MREIDYTILPEHIREGMRQYIEEGCPVGGFLYAVLSDSLVGAFARADQINTIHMRDIANFLYNEVPTDIWGSRTKVNAWLQRKEQERAQARTNRIEESRGDE